jgi:hypothetical protein
MEYIFYLFMICEISGFHHGGVEACALLRCYAAQVDRQLVAAVPGKPIDSTFKGRE